MNLSSFVKFYQSLDDYLSPPLVKLSNYETKKPRKEEYVGGCKMVLPGFILDGCGSDQKYKVSDGCRGCGAYEWKDDKCRYCGNDKY